MEEIKKNEEKIQIRTIIYAVIIVVVGVLGTMTCIFDYMGETGLAVLLFLLSAGVVVASIMIIFKMAVKEAKIKLEHPNVKRRQYLLGVKRWLGDWWLFVVLRQVRLDEIVVSVSVDGVKLDRVYPFIIK